MNPNPFVAAVTQVLNLIPQRPKSPFLTVLDVPSGKRVKGETPAAIQWNGNDSCRTNRSNRRLHLQDRLSERQDHLSSVCLHEKKLEPVPICYCIGVNWKAPEIRTLVRSALLEDNARHDITTHILIDPSWKIEAAIVAKQKGIVAGLPLAEKFLKALDPSIRFKPNSF